MSLEGKNADEITALAALADSVLGNQKTRGAFLRMQKQVNPNVSIPEIDIQDSIAAQVKPHVEEVERMRLERERDKSQQAATALYENLREAGAVKNRTEFSALVTYASEKGFQTTEGGLRMAASHRASEQEAAEPTPMPGAIDLSQPKEHKDLMRDPAGWANRTAREALDELHGKQRRA